MQRAKILLEPLFALPDVRRAWIVGPVREPEHDVTALERTRNGDAVARVGERAVSHRRVRITERSELVALILEEVWIDRPGPNLVPCGQLLNPVDVGDAVREIPEHVQS